MTARAFTLLELILVLAVLGILASVVAARLSGLRGTQGVELAARQLVEQAQRARHLAISRSLPVRLRLDLATPAVQVQLLRDGAPTDPADGHDARVVLRGGSERLTSTFVRDDAVAMTGQVADIMFWPDARSDPAGTWSIATTGRSAAVHIPGGPRPVTVAIGNGTVHAP